jgi:hypothetical protein
MAPILAALLDSDVSKSLTSSLVSTRGILVMPPPLACNCLDDEGRTKMRVFELVTAEHKRRSRSTIHDPHCSFFAKSLSIAYGMPRDKLRSIKVVNAFFQFSKLQGIYQET